MNSQNTIIHFCLLLWTSFSLPVQGANIQDPWIQCPGPPPPQTAGYPAGRSARDYATNLQLCSYVYGATYNVGCFCPDANAGFVTCDEQEADPALYHATPNVGVLQASSFPLYCQQTCHCLDVEATTQQGGVQASQESQQGNTAGQVGENLANTTIGNGGDIELYNASTTSNSSSEYGQAEACSASCALNSDCSTNCACKPQSQVYEPGSGIIYFNLACASSLGGRKRDSDSFPCVCNGTYVSHACCDAHDGMVWESEDMKLGQVLSSEL